jgi:hypothetical protein
MLKFSIVGLFLLRGLVPSASLPTMPLFRYFSNLFSEDL